ncbi:pyridoxal-dependent decarboxylase, exosortase A system-associated [Iodidimonas muriae]|uniref:Pyridoxal-dependent decarboxylase, exosortase A system-associated n=2 Tax=Iodidimonas muriae TaxID=261467 RepID=A0ABQ2L8V7_9PROT|nr:pyridoxal-dependent decarboxylase, exosortase A system-associated [Iodidimonas muriae]GER06499.1 pyridoxal-dependent decarboxylase, exosortase A system-associated [Kordiimonadales bacterium JCM 17843]GGO05021.1 pyridoxal-dependent decarboxylase, exosortase A system-associated [Iodidimonas muriae]
MVEMKADAERMAQHHPAFADWAFEDGHLLVGGIPVGQLAQRLGQTPFYAYDREKITARVNALRAALPKAVRLHYAIKANPMPAVVQHLSGLVDGFDIASANELDVALDAGMSNAHISFAGPAKTDAELKRAIAGGIVVELESLSEMDRCAKAGDSLGMTPRVAVRVNPDFKLRGSGMHMGGGPSQFGVDAEMVPEMLSQLAGLGLAFEGFHIFGGSQNLSAEAVAVAEDQIADLAIRLADHALTPVRHLNIGGGFGIPYTPKDKAFDLPLVGARLHETVEKLGRALPKTAVIVELGRYIVGEAGVYVCKVIDRKISRGQVYLVTDGGLHHQLAATGNFGQGIRRNYPVAIASHYGEEPVETVNVVGCLCTPIDLLADKISVPRADVGDLVAIFQSGAYGRTASPSRFLSHPEAKEALV